MSLISLLVTMYVVFFMFSCFSYIVVFLFEFLQYFFVHLYVVFFVPLTQNVIFFPCNIPNGRKKTRTDNIKLILQGKKIRGRS